MYIVLADPEEVKVKENVPAAEWCGCCLRPYLENMNYLKKLVIVLLHLHVTDGT